MFSTADHTKVKFLHASVEDGDIQAGELGIGVASKSMDRII